LALLTQNKAKLCKMLIITLIFEKNANFFAEICQKSQKIVILTSSPDPGTLPTYLPTYLQSKLSTRAFAEACW
jgi:serine kinase of HPr protein (carbohydrate metabolism regulator)